MKQQLLALTRRELREAEPFVWWTLVWMALLFLGLMFSVFMVDHFHEGLSENSTVRIQLAQEFSDFQSDFPADLHVLQLLGSRGLALSYLGAVLFLQQMIFLFITFHVLGRGFYREKLQGAELFFRSLPVQTWKNLLVKISWSTLGVALFALAAEILFLLPQLVVIAVASGLSPTLEFGALVEPLFHWRNLWLLLELNLVQLLWLVPWMIYLVAVSLLARRMVSLLAFGIPVLLGMAELLVLKTGHLFQGFFYVFNLPLHMEVRVRKGFLGKSAAEGSLVGDPGSYLAFWLVALMLLAAGWIYHEYREIV